MGTSLAVATLLPGVALWDTAELQTVGPLMGTAHPTGSPAWVLLGWVASVVLLPFGEPAYRMNLLNAMCIGAACGLTATLVRMLTGRAWLGFLTGVLLATTPIAWSIGTHADTHGLLLALVALLLVLLVGWEQRVGSGQGRADRWLVSAAGVYGLTLGVHGLILLLAPGIALYVLAVERRAIRRRDLVARCLVALLVVLTVVELELPLRAGPFRAPLVYGHPETWTGFWQVVLAGQFLGSLVAPFSDLGRKSGDLVTRAIGQLGPLVWLVLPGLAVAARRRPAYALLTATSLGLVCWFAASYDNASIERYYLIPLLVALTWIAILGDGVVRWLEARAAGIASARRIGAGDLPAGGRGSVVRLASTVAVAVAFLVLLLPTAAALPERWRGVDLSHDRQAAAWLDAMLDEQVVARGAVVLSWWSYSTPLWYAQLVEGRRPDIAIIDDRTRLDEHLGDLTDVIDANLGRRPVIVIQIDPVVVDGLAARYRLSRLAVPGDQPVYRVDGRAGGGIGPGDGPALVAIPR